VGGLVRFLFNNPMIKPILRPITRLLIGAIAIPIFRIFLRRIVRLQELDAEMEKDLEQWFRGSLVLLAATANMENALFSWMFDRVSFVDLRSEEAWIMVGFRLLMAIAAIESMPDQELFAIIHPGPPKMKFGKKNGYWREFRKKFRPLCRGLICQHINRASPVFAIMAAIAPGRIGWICYIVAITQYLIIGLVTSRDKALDVLNEFDRHVAIRRRELVEEFQGGEPSKANADPETDEETDHRRVDEPSLPAQKTSSDEIAKAPEGGYVSE
jgi:hypothetical protein